MGSVVVGKKMDPGQVKGGGWGYRAGTELITGDSGTCLYGTREQTHSALQVPLSPVMGEFSPSPCHREAGHYQCS